MLLIVYLEQLNHTTRALISAFLDSNRSRNESSTDPNDYNKALKRLLRKNTEVDVVVMARQLFSYLMEQDPMLKKQSDLLTVLEPAYQHYDLYNLVTRKKPEAEHIIKQYNQALKEMKDDGTYAAILKRFGQE